MEFFKEVGILQAIKIFLFPSERQFVTVNLGSKKYSLSEEAMLEMLSTYIDDKVLLTLRYRKSELMVKGKDCSKEEKIELSNIIRELNGVDYPQYVFNK